MENDFSKFEEIRKLYSAALPEWMGEYEKTGNMWFDPYLMDWDFSPIEKLVWSDIRSLAVPFYPQIPVLNYFIDFGNPFLKIGIECDGKEWHDKERDAARDRRLAAEGWMIFRIEGHECVREIDIHDHESRTRTERDAVDMDRYFGLTSEGIVKAIKLAYFCNDPNVAHDWRATATLHMHRSTPETRPVRRPIIQKPSGPVHISDLLYDYAKTLERRMARK